MTESFLNRFRIVRLIGQGGSGAVYEATDTTLDRTVAIKEVPVAPGGDGDLMRERFRREARLTAQLRHPNIVGIYEWAEEDGKLYIVMEYVDGHSLEHSMAETPKADWWERYLPALRECAGVIDYVHQKGIVHGDIKPGNIMVESGGHPKILDFGLARIAHEQSITFTGSIAGTLSYYAPELIRGEPASPAADQYALAVIAYQLATGVTPFAGDSAAALMYKVMQEEPVPVSALNRKIPDAVSRAILRALSKDPARRFQTCGEFLDPIELPSMALERDIVVGRPITLKRPAAAPPPPPSAVPGSWIRRMIDSLFKPGVRGGVETAPAPASAPARAPAPASAPAGEQTVILRRPVDSRLDPLELAQRQANELIQIATKGEFEPAVVLRGKWLPGVEGADATLLAFREAARYLVAARNATSPHNAIEHLTRAESVLIAAGNQLLQGTTAEATALPAALEAWKLYTRNKLAEGRALVERQLPNPYRAGQPLRPDQGQVLFRGRDQIVRQIESILVDANQSGSIALLGPRRCGKTSLLQMLPALLPDCVCVFFDLQDNPVDSTQAFFQALERQAREQSRRDRRVDLPPLSDGGSFGSATQWLQDLDNLPGDHRILFCLDEFERLEDLFPGNRQDLLRLMGLFRATIQHRRRLRLLVSGVAPFDELGQIWNDHFINVREIRVGHLDSVNAIDLLRHPLPGFPEDAVPEPVAARVFERTGGQPYLLQLYGSLLITHLNEQQRRCAEMDDVAKIEEEAMSQGAYYFRHTYESAPAEPRRALEELAVGRRAEMSAPVLRWLSRRGLVDHEGTLCIPVLGTFMRDELDLR
jgi:serine/threonine protein kinase